MGIDFYDRMWEEEQKEKERFGQRKNEIENELSNQRRSIEQLEKENAELKEQIKLIESVSDANADENAELKEQNSILKNDVRVAREDRERLQIKVGKGLKEFILDCPYTGLKYYASARLVEENEQLKQQIEKMKCCGNCKYRYIGTCIIYDKKIAGDCYCDKWEFDK